MAKLLMRTGATVWVQKMLYKVVVRTVLIYGINIWVVTVAMLKFLEGYHHRVSRWIVGKTDCRTVD